MPKLLIKDYRYSYVYRDTIGKEYTVDCEIVEERKHSVRVFVPEFGRELTVKKDKIVDYEIKREIPRDEEMPGLWERLYTKIRQALKVCGLLH